MFNASKAKVENYKELGLNSETAVVFNITSREQVILNTWYGGEMKKVVIVGILGSSPPDGVFRVVVHDDELVFGRTTGIYAGHNVYGVKFGSYTFFISFE